MSKQFLVSSVSIVKGGKQPREKLTHISTRNSIVPDYTEDYLFFVKGSFCTFPNIYVLDCQV